MDKDSKQLNLVHIRDLDGLLEGLGIKEKFDKDGLPCKFCKEVVCRKNIYSFLPESGSVNLVCDNPQCITSLMEYLDEKKRMRLEQ